MEGTSRARGVADMPKERCMLYLLEKVLLVYQILKCPPWLMNRGSNPVHFNLGKEFTCLKLVEEVYGK